MIKLSKPLWGDSSSDLDISFAFGPYYLDKNDAPVIGRDAGYRMLDTGLKRYSGDFINRRRATRGISALTVRAISFANIQ
jgi:hypothetical protein